MDFTFSRIAAGNDGGSFKPMVSAATCSGSLYVLMADLAEGAEIEEVNAVEGEGFHVWIGGKDQESLRYRRVFDGNGLLGYRAVKWASSSEFVTGGYGFGLQLWDQRKGGEAVSQLKGNWFQGKTFAVVHSIDIHPSRKHTCIAGGSSGTVFAWDLRWPKQPIVLSGVWEVQYDSDTKSNISSSSRILPVMTCSEDGILGVIEQGEEPIELLAEPCAINSFDIDRQNPQPRVGVNSNLLKALAYRPVQGTICFWFSSEPQQRNGGWETSLNVFIVSLQQVVNNKDMLERSHSLRIPGAETLDLRIALYEHKEVIERLQDELNAEREASSTSASEALSMILRLQGEKAELAREAAQYKRIAQEEMSHAEMWFAHLEDFIHQKENVITALEYQVEAYRSQLLSLGYSDLNSLDVKLQENDVRSQIPFPELVNDLSIPVEKEVIEESVDTQKSYFDVYWDHIKKLDEKVKELKTEDGLMMKVAKQTKMKKKSTKQTRDRSGKRDRAEYQSEMQRLRERVEQLEKEKTKTEPETSGVILMEMKEEVRSVQSSEEKRSNTMENLQPWIDPAIVSVQEAMLSFWL
ncbi:hypothetical protein IGI04_000648 [Brassica rapa subsp. trilocularis]|uniref:GTD-binding domain-containing protein n=1 Tax=Brassica rapa subsp. trilocularis TaxID=1813537 RepID=A0ABQ7NRE9_BRACM|nr:hypothetical protein IGI04_000648 [Brassica rapa subsp. trilocularis]